MKARLRSVAQEVPQILKSVPGDSSRGFSLPESTFTSTYRAIQEVAVTCLTLVS
jgi:hypothetical protein